MAGFRFASAMGKWIETLMRDHKEADSISEESIRNYKTVTALGAESSMERKYVSLVRSVIGSLRLDRKVQENAAEIAVSSGSVERFEHVYQQHCDFVGLLLHDHSCIQPTQRIPY